ncbi:FAD-dependent oxidoreductase, partial [Microbacterium sp.]|uniref:FAD-dependent oxidoreductase n=1 Tax=Microbacterium sp. TaxID=51671 RepID=UPI003C70E56D
MSHDSYDLVVVGAGIVGLGHAAAALERGLKVAVVERSTSIGGATVRNFGHVGVSDHVGKAAEYARRSRELWLRLAERAGFWVGTGGGLAVARHADELAVLHESDVGTPLDAAEVWRLAPVV